MVYVFDGSTIQQWDGESLASTIMGVREFFSGQTVDVFSKPGLSLIDTHLSTSEDGTVSIDTETSEMIFFEGGLEVSRTQLERV